MPFAARGVISPRVSQGRCFAQVSKVGDFDQAVRKTGDDIQRPPWPCCGCAKWRGAFQRVVTLERPRPDLFSSGSQLARGFIKQSLRNPELLELLQHPCLDAELKLRLKMMRMAVSSI
jgi:hypothetical protein